MGDRTLTLADGVEITEKPQEAVLESFREDLRYTNNKYPDAYVKSIDILSMERLREKECQEWDEFAFEQFQKEIVYRDFYDYRFYRVEYEWRYTEAKKKLIPQLGEGKYYQVFLAATHSDIYETYCVTMPFGLD